MTLTPAELSEIRARAGRMVRNRVAGPGRPRQADRCPCGAMTKARALARRHKCEAPALSMPDSGASGPR